MGSRSSDPCTVGIQKKGMRPMRPVTSSAMTNESPAAVCVTVARETPTDRCGTKNSLLLSVDSPTRH